LQLTIVSGHPDPDESRLLDQISMDTSAVVGYRQVSYGHASLAQTAKYLHAEEAVNYRR
jgi:hypothetical protein